MHGPADRFCLDRSLDTNHLRDLRIDAPRLTSLRVLHETAWLVEGLDTDLETELYREAAALLRFSPLVKLDLSDLQLGSSESKSYASAIGRVDARELILPRHHLLLLRIVRGLPHSPRLQGLQVLTLQGDSDNEMWKERSGPSPFPAQEPLSEHITNIRDLATALLKPPKLYSLGGTSPAVQAVVNVHLSGWRAASQDGEPAACALNCLEPLGRVVSCDCKGRGRFGR